MAFVGCSGLACTPVMEFVGRRSTSTVGNNIRAIPERIGFQFHEGCRLFNKSPTTRDGKQLRNEGRKVTRHQQLVEPFRSQDYAGRGHGNVDGGSGRGGAGRGRLMGAFGSRGGAGRGNASDMHMTRIQKGSHRSNFEGDDARRPDINR